MAAEREKKQTGTIKDEGRMELVGQKEAGGSFASPDMLNGD